MSGKKFDQLERYGGAVFLIAVVASDFMFGITAAVKVVGVTCIATGILWMLRRSVPVGIENRPPSFYLGGLTALFAGMVMAAVGAFLLACSGLAICLFGWANNVEC